ncbi:MAG: adenylosuccinate lyase [Candidatus Latescibacteria bacterium]|nr:adenylosuccinate lyase [Candidatus Latescibacterota bacterium]NIM22075.1 adenylosuccinate lyase [Candidatus Latescibacterota bacterium]NIM66094.1 adenylosuccinate lyase [Candidatus Latescibacterota bacterium]NIO02502.1 adenylosuccinate lyase [Candidatus Latescibacterota bacterium]NIO29413.1 adenylosuccinate lyase [Candidatus Latescibacterota bacterium]
MIERYTLPVMGRIWSEENKFQKWLEIEILVCEALASMGEIPKDAVKRIREKAAFDSERIKEIEETTHHDVIAFLTNVAEHVGDDSRYIHIGMTSSDLLDTALAATLKEAGEKLLSRLSELKAVIKERALEHKRTVMVGRTHGIHAEPITFGLKLIVWYDELSRREQALERAIDTISFGKISGAVGNYAHLDPKVETYVIEKLGLKPAPVSTQILQRDRHAEFVSALALVAASLEKMATEVRNLQRTDVLEVEEYFEEGQKGSSAMPHKRNPITCERICGLARIIRANAIAAMENVTLWHERDISHSSVERVILPDSTIALDYMLERFAWVIKRLIVYPDRMRQNLERTNGLIYSQKLLLELAKTGISREEAYAAVQEAAMETWERGKPFEQSVREREAITLRMDGNTLDSIFTLDAFLKSVDEIFERVV